MSKAQEDWTTLLTTNPKSGVEFVAQRFNSPDSAERASRLLTRAGLPSRCVPWLASDFPGYPRKTTTKEKR